MVIRKAVCKLCKECFRENGDDNLDRSIDLHYMKKHKDVHREFEKDEVEAGKRIDKVMAEYPNQILRWGGHVFTPTHSKAKIERTEERHD